MEAVFHFRRERPLFFAFLVSDYLLGLSVQGGFVSFQVAEASHVLAVEEAQEFGGVSDLFKLQAAGLMVWCGGDLRGHKRLV